ncbi:MAG TPA: RNA polymerase sigma factor [Lacibacter sp.]|nr:RNA polymerase sigma factor [Lacibacter sp.]HMO88420.1 RNA polymerase sigma factor [Lacibacter sp.]HMP85894.1 RNA polymerase sigma factor [Lacibacter sp.]
MNDNEQAWIHELLNGNEAAFRRLVEEYQHLVYNTVLSIVQNEADAEELTQDVFVQAHRSIGGFKGDAKLSTWLYRIAGSKALDHLRRKKAKKRLAWLYREPIDPEAATEIPVFYHPGVALEQKEQAALLFRLIRQLPDKQRLAFTLNQAEGLSAQEIAPVLGISAGAAESLLFRARSRLRELLQEAEKK